MQVIQDGTRDCFYAIRHMSDDQYHVSNFAGQVLDSPSTTSATTLCKSK